MESKGVTFIETPPHPLPPPSKFTPLQDLVPPSWDRDHGTLHNDYISYDNLLWDVRDYYNGVLDFTTNLHANHENASGVSRDPQVQWLVNQIRDLTRRDLLTPAAPLPGAVSTSEPLPGAVTEPLSGGTSPPSGGASQETKELSPAPVPATARKGAAMRNNRMNRPNVVTGRAAVELTGVVTRYRGVRPNNNNNDNNNDNDNNNNHVALAGHFQPNAAQAMTTRSLHQHRHA